MTEIDKKKCYPVDSEGNMLEYEYCYGAPVAAWIPMEPFSATLSFIKYEKGRSSLRFILSDVASRATYSMMAQSIDEFVQNAHNGILTARWKPVKRGANYGLILEEVL